MRRTAIGAKPDNTAGVSTSQTQLETVEPAVQEQSHAAELSQALSTLEQAVQQLPDSQQHARTAGLPKKVLAKLGPLQPAAKAVWGVVSAVEPRLRGLILLNIMTFVMGKCKVLYMVVVSTCTHVCMH